MTSEESECCNFLIDEESKGCSERSELVTRFSTRAPVEDHYFYYIRTARLNGHESLEGATRLLTYDHT